MSTFNFATDYILENDFVRLRPLTHDDIEHLLYFLFNEPEIWKYSLLPVSSEQDLKKYIHDALQGRKEAKEYPFIVFDKRQNKYAGSTRFYDIQLANSSLQLGYTWYGKQHQGTGLNKHCKYLLLGFAFEEIEMQRVEFRANNNNERSIHAMQSIGCSVEGVLRKNLSSPDGTRRDTIVLSILKDEWTGRIKDELRRILVV